MLQRALAVLAVFGTFFAPLAAVEGPMQHFCCDDVHILERLVVAFPEDEQNNWKMIHGREGDRGEVVEVWQKEGAEERLSIVTSPWGDEGTVSVIDAIEKIAQAFPGHIEVMRRTKGEEEIVLTLHYRNQWQFVRVITTPYALHIANYSYRGDDCCIDLEYYVSLLDQYVYLVY